ncbi:MAG: ABC transporter permease [Alphaproteobacteria bacterium]|nr:ABC transporter permease [Alphaproteobacteria bacterium]
MSEKPGIDIRPGPEGAMELALTGAWIIGAVLPDLDALLADPKIAGAHRLRLADGGIADWDSILLTYLRRLEGRVAERGATTDRSGLPEGVVRLLALAEAVPRREDTGAPGARPGIVTRAGEAVLRLGAEAAGMVAFLGLAAMAFGKFVLGRARFRGSDLALMLEDCGPKALPIVTLISVLVGLILAFVGAVQLQLFGAEIFIANLVAIGMAREMGALMAAIIMAGRTGAAFAAELGTMQVNEEIDAFVTLGISPMEFLVLPRMIALALMMPLLCLYADLMGILGGAVVGIFMLDISPIQYFNQTKQFLGMGDFAVGVFKAAVFGVLIAISGCMRGMQCGRSSQAVGMAATSAVVLAIVLIICADGVFAVLFHIMGI